MKLGEGSMASDGRGTRESVGVEIRGVGKVIRNERLGSARKCMVGNYGKRSVG